MIALKQQRELANIDNIGIIQHEGRYHIVTEWSRLPIESYDFLHDAIDFCRGFKGMPINKETKPYSHGYMLRSFVETDLIFGIGYYKVNNIPINIIQTVTIQR